MNKKTPLLKNHEYMTLLPLTHHSEAHRFCACCLHFSGSLSSRGGIFCRDCQTSGGYLSVPTNFYASSPDAASTVFRDPASLRASELSTVDSSTPS